MSELLRTASIRRIEQAWVAALGGGVLMQRAAAAVADAAARVARTLPRTTPILSLVGPGNNGGDALLAARLLRERGFPVAAIALSPGPPAAADALAVWQGWHAAGLGVEPLSALPQWLARHPIVIDGLFGIGLARPVEGEVAAAVRALDRGPSAVIAVDVPSGIDADRGCVVGGRDGVAVRASLTVTMIADKPGLHTGAAVDHVGEVRVAPLDLDGWPVAGETAPVADGRLFDRSQACLLAPARPRDAHKGSFGGVLVVGGARGTSGAALLAARGAQCTGAGKVFVASPDGSVFDPGQPQLMTRAFDAPFEGLEAVAIGCGLGTGETARHGLERALRSPLPLAIDADALNLAAREPALARRLAARDAPSVLTPHPLEAARLLGASTAEVQGDRIAAANELARRTGAVVLLKGAGTIVAAPARGGDPAAADWTVNASGGPTLASGGSGDVLAGVIAALLARGLPAADAARLGAWLHGDAGDLWQRRHPSGTGLSAARLPELLVDALDTLYSNP
jgi:hydroxyethylthiazole kinase-like uncharacterized protein yjeF